MGRRFLVRNRLQKHCEGTDFYTFGVYNGDSMLYLMSNFTFRKSFGFDSFEGIPQEEVDPYNYKDWQKGFYDVRKYYKCNKEEAIQIVTKRLQDNHKNVEIIPGYWNEILTDNLVADLDMKPAYIVDIDCDIYSSCLEALDFMFRNRLVVLGTLLYYDDWGGALINCKEYEGGESRAHKEMCEKYGIETKKIFTSGKPPCVGVVFEVTGITANF